MTSQAHITPAPDTSAPDSTAPDNNEPDRAAQSGKSAALPSFKLHSQHLTNEASVALIKKDPALSAIRVLSHRQMYTGIFLLFSLIMALILWPVKTLIIFNTVISLYFIATIFFRLTLFILSWNDPISDPDTHQNDPAPSTPDDQLPVITILLPLYDEAESLPVLVNALNALDYPKEKLDIKLLLEEDDQATQQEAQSLALQAYMDVLVLPPSHPKTKPKACNCGLYNARGQIIVIYDAEDQPEPDQLRKAVAAFEAGDDHLACVQAKLNYYNDNDNWLTRLFAIEYALWFDCLLPALEKLSVPIPLGGTSNFFKTDILLGIGGWDPFNVTEDADLGLRLAGAGYQTKILNSTTYEEANCNLPNWLRQRSRWLKGYMQTWLVHNRRPLNFLKTVGLGGFISSQLFIAGNFVSALINPFLWFVFILWHITGMETIQQFFPGPLLWINLFAFLAGNFLLIFMAMLAPLKRGWAHLSPSALLMPLYWALTAIAAHKALFQLFFRPHYWEKTDHMLSRSAKEKRDQLRKTDKRHEEKRHEEKHHVSSRNKGHTERKPPHG